MKVNKLSIFGGLMALASCVADDVDELSLADHVPVNLSVSAEDNDSLAVYTRYNNSVLTFDSGENIAVYVKPSTASSFTGYTYTTAGSGQSTTLNAPATQPYFPAGSGTSVTAYAYYPSNAGSSFQVSTDQTTETGYKASDLMCSSQTNISKSAGSGTLTMNHKMAQLKIVPAVASGSGLSIKGVTVNAYRSTTFTASSNSVSSPTTKADITTNTGTSYTLIPPQAINGVSIKIATGSGTATYTFSSSSSFESGKTYTINLTVGLQDVKATTTISNWNGTSAVTVNPTKVTNVCRMSLDNLPSNAVGWIIATDGYAYATATEAQKMSASPVAMIVYVGSDTGVARYTKGLAVSLKNLDVDRGSYKDTDFEWGPKIECDDIGYVSSTSSVFNSSTQKDGLAMTEKNYNWLVENNNNKPQNTPYMHARIYQANNPGSIYYVAKPGNTSDWFVPSIFQCVQMLRSFDPSLSDNSNFYVSCGTVYACYDYENVWHENDTREESGQAKRFPLAKSRLNAALTEANGDALYQMWLSNAADPQYNFISLNNNEKEYAWILYSDYMYACDRSESYYARGFLAF